MNVPSQEELLHLKIQAAMRENDFAEDQMKYLGERAGHHWYLIAGEHEYKINGQHIVVTSQIEEFDQVEEDDA